MTPILATVIRNASGKQVPKIVMEILVLDRFNTVFKIRLIGNQKAILQYQYVFRTSFSANYKPSQPAKKIIFRVFIFI